MTAVFESCMCDSIYRFVMFNVRYSLFDTYFPLLMCLFFYSVSLVSKITYMCAVAIEFYLKLTVNQFILLFMIWRGGKFLMSFHANSIWLLWVSWFFLFFFWNFMNQAWALYVEWIERNPYIDPNSSFYVTDWMSSGKYITANYERWFRFKEIYSPKFDINVISVQFVEYSVN